jgi:hypothetical protein
MGRRLICGFCLLALAAASLTPFSVEAKPPPRPEYHTALLRLAASNGYTVEVAGFSRGSSGKGLVFARAFQHGSAASYAVPGLISATEMRADFGSLGTVDLSIHPSGQTEKVHPRCSHVKIDFEPATYEGLVEFHGEGGYTEARATSAPAVPLASSICGLSGSGEARGSGLPGARLHGISFAHGRSLSFQVNKNGPHSRVFYEAESKEQRGKVSIRRAVSGIASSGSFAFGPRLRRARLAPPAPFSGSARLTRKEGELLPRWRGNLAVEFPGRKVPLTGDGVHVSIVHARLTRSGSGVAEAGF